MKRSLFIVLLAFAGCAQILDLEERSVDANPEIDSGVDGGHDHGHIDASFEAGSFDAGPDTPGCIEYCDLAEQLCTPDRNVQLFQTRETCMAVCAKYSKDPSTTGNTLACRLQQLRGLKGAGSNEAQTACPAASPGGGGAPGETSINCGTNCEGFCALRAATCPLQAGDIDCARKCQALVDDEPFNASADFGSGSDTLSCRIAHLSAATYYERLGMPGVRDAHCSHSGIKSDVQCDFKDPFEPECESYCKLVGTACTGDFAIYETPQQCLDACKDMVKGKLADKAKEGTLRCLREGAYNALANGPTQCPKASIAGDDCNGSRCTSYCTLAKQFCPAEFKQANPTDDLGECSGKCLALPGALPNTPYSVTRSEKDAPARLECRLLRLTRAMAGENTCAAALGLSGGACFTSN